MALRRNKIGKLVIVAGALASMVGLSGCGGMSTGTGADNSAKGFGYKGSSTASCYIADKSLVKNGKYRSTYGDAFKLKYRWEPKSFFEKPINPRKFVPLAKRDYELFTLQSISGKYVKCFRDGIIPVLSMSFYRTGFITPEEVDEVVAARTLKWTDYKNPYYKANDGATKVLVFTSKYGNQLAYPFTTTKERKFIELKTYAFDKLALGPLFYATSPKVLSADSYSFDRQAQINELLRILSIDKPDSKTIKSWKKKVNANWLAAMKLDEVKKKVAADEKAEKEANAKRDLIERKKAERKIANGQGVEL